MDTLWGSVNSTRPEVCRDRFNPSSVAVTLGKLLDFPGPLHAE